MAKKLSAVAAQLYDVVSRAYHGAKPGFSARGLSREKADTYADEMAVAHPGTSYEVVPHDSNA